MKNASKVLAIAVALTCVSASASTDKSVHCPRFDMVKSVHTSLRTYHYEGRNDDGKLFKCEENHHDIGYPIGWFVINGFNSALTTYDVTTSTLFCAYDSYFQYTDDEEPDLSTWQKEELLIRNVY